ncbi:MAG: 1,4-dihydroxy-2-naphthoate octaprenyltransferase [Roseivirga sp.]
MTSLKKWVIATRLETIVLAWASVGLGSALAAFTGVFGRSIGLLAALTASLLQVICNLANDYGDFVHGADLINKARPPSALQTGLVTLEQMRQAFQLLVGPTIGCGVLLLYCAALDVYAWSIFLLLGFLAVVAAITYTVGKRPYGYRGGGDIAVLLFFGLIGVGGTFYLHTKALSSIWLLPAISYGCLVVGVLNVNNLRDIAADEQVGKQTVPVRIGKTAAVYYHWALLAVSIVTILAFLLRYANAPWPYLCLGTVPFLIQHGVAVSRQAPAQLTQQLQKLVLLQLVFVCLLIAGLLLGAKAH